MERAQRVQIGVLIACLVVGVGIVVWMMAGGIRSGGRQIVIDPNAPPVTQPTTRRVATTRPMSRQFEAAVNGTPPNHARAMELFAADPKLATVEFAQRGFATALHYAAALGDFELADALLENGANIDAVEDRHNGTPLEWATFEGRLDMLDYLLWRGAKIDDVSRQLAAEFSKTGNPYQKIPKATYVEILKRFASPRPTSRPATRATTRAAAKPTSGPG